jgi:hypothetical protein
LTVPPVATEGAGRFRKRRGLGCPGCRLCHRDKYNRVPTRADLLADLRQREGLNDILHRLRTA